MVPLVTILFPISTCRSTSACVPLQTFRGLVPEGRDPSTLYNGRVVYLQKTVGPSRGLGQKIPIDTSEVVYPYYLVIELEIGEREGVF